MLWPVGVSYWDNICHVVFAPHVEHTKYDLVQYGRTRSARLPSSKCDGASGKQVPSDASVAGHLPPLPEHSYVAKHTATYHPTLPSSTCVFKHYPCVFKHYLHLANTPSTESTTIFLCNNSTSSTTNNGCIQASMPSTRQPSFHSYGSYSSPLL